MAETKQYDYDVALSFAGENRETVAVIAECLRGRGVKVFYDDFEKTRLWGKDLQAHLANVYMRWARYAVVFVSVHYRDRVWTRHELKAALARALEERGDYVLPVRFDDTELDGLLPTIDYLDLRRDTPTEVCIRICEKLGIGSRGYKADAGPAPWSRSVNGFVSFDYSNHNGRYCIGQGVYEFETRWSKASDISIYCYNDAPSIRGIAVAPIGMSVKDINDAGIRDYTSRARQPRLEQVVVLENVNGFFAALHITSIKDSSQYAGPDELSFDYWILRDGGRDFSAVERL